MAPPRTRVWVWLLTVLLLALLVLAVGHHMRRGPRSEVGVTDVDAAPRGAVSTQPVEERAASAPGDASGAMPEPTAAPADEGVGVAAGSSQKTAPPR